jgi:hypothetical protein
MSAIASPPCEPHVVERPLPLLRGALVGGVLDARDRAGDRDRLRRRRPPGHGRGRRRRRRSVTTRSNSAPSSVAAPPRLDGRVPVASLRRVGLVLEVGEGGLVGGDQPGPCSALDGHVADRHPALHREVLEGLPAVLDDVPDPAVDADDVEDVQDQVLRGGPDRQRPLDLDRERLRHPLRQGLGGEDVLDLGGADPERERPERAVGGGVGVAADDDRPGWVNPSSGPMMWTMPWLRLPMGNSRIPNSSQLRAAPRAGDRQLVGHRQLTAHLPGVGRHVVVHRRERQVRPADRPPACRSPSNACGEVTSCTRCRST